MKTRVTVYFPNKSIKQGYISLFREMLAEISGSWWLTWQLFRRNFSATYKQSVMGVFWAIAFPLVSVGTFILLNQGGIMNVGQVAAPYPLFAVAGIAFWQLFTLGLTLSANALVNAGSMITKLNFTKETLIISSVAQGVVPCLLQMLLALLLFAVYQTAPPLTALLAPLALIPLLMLTLGLGFLISLVNGVMRDAGNGISVLVTFLMFATPILYARPSSGIVAAITRYNPLYYLVAVPRDLLIFGRTGELTGFFYSTLLAIGVLLISWMVFHLTEARVTERI